MAMLTFENLIKAILVIVIVVIVILFIKTSAFDLVKNILKITDDKEEVSKEEALVNFQEVEEIYSNCFASKQNQCVCFKSSFPQFPASSRLGFYEGDGFKRIILFDKEDKEEKTIVQTEVNGSFGCWMTYQRDENGNYLYRAEYGMSMYFDKSQRYLIGTKDKVGSLPNDFPFLYKTNDGRVCFVLDEMITNNRWYQGDLFPGVKQQRTALKEHISSLPVCS